MRPLARIFTDSVKFFDLASFRIGDYHVELTPGTSYIPCELAVVFGMPKADGATDATTIRSDVHTRHAGPLLVVESCIIGRVALPQNGRLVDRLLGRSRKTKFHHPYWRLALNAAFGPEADFNNKHSPSDRWERLNIPIQPYRRSGNHVLLIGQTPGDTSLRGVDIVEWLVETATQIRAATSRPILVRFHPTMDELHERATRVRIERIKNTRIVARGQPINESLANAWVTVSLSSGAAIDSLIAGVPAITLSSASLAYDFTSHDLSEIEHPVEPPREQWLYDLAYAQWSPEEFANGTAWRHIAPAVMQKPAGKTQTSSAKSY